MRGTVIVAGKQADERMLMAEALRIVSPDTRIDEVFDESRFEELIQAAHDPVLVIVGDQNNLPVVRTMLDAKYPARKIPIVILSSENVDKESVLDSNITAVFARPVTLEGFLNTARLIANHSSSFF